MQMIRTSLTHPPTAVTVLFIAFLGPLAVGVVGCSGLQETEAPTGQEGNLSLPQLMESTVPIGDIEASAVDTDITVQGTVQQTVPLLNRWLYEIKDDDNTGTVWILSAEPPPAVGDQVRLRGTLSYRPIVIGELEQGEYYLEEKQRTPLSE